MNQLLAAIFTLVVLLTSPSCARKNETIVLSGMFPTEYTITMSEISEIELICPSDLIFIDGFLVTINNCYDYLLQIIRVSDRETRFSLNKGRGPREFLSLLFKGHKQGDSVFLSNAPISSAWVRPCELFEGNMESFQIIDEPRRGYPSSGVFDLGNKWVVNSMGGDGFFVFINKQNLDEVKIKHPPLLSYHLEGEAKGYAFDAPTMFHYEKGLFVSALQFLPYFIITDMKGNYRKIVRTQPTFEEPLFSTGKIIPEGNPEFFYSRVYASDDHIFLFRLNVRLQDSDAEADPVVEVYDWEGRPIAKLKFDRLIGKIVYDFTTGKIYGIGICKNEERLLLLEGQLPEQLF